MCSVGIFKEISTGRLKLSRSWPSGQEEFDRPQGVSNKAASHQVLESFRICPWQIDVFYLIAKSVQIVAEVTKLTKCHTAYKTTVRNNGHAEKIRIDLKALFMLFSIH